MLNLRKLIFTILTAISSTSAMSNSTLVCYTISPEGPETQIGTIPNVSTTDSQQHL